MPTAPKTGKGKAGCLFAGGAVVLGIWLLNSPKTRPVSRQVAPLASPLPISSPLAALSAQASSYAPEPSATIMRATRVRSAAEQARLKKYVPTRVKLRQDLEFRATSENATMPSVYVGQGKEVNVVRVTGSELIVEYAGWQATLPISKTDFLDRVIAEVEK
jgi:hypothetical protein